LINIKEEGYVWNSWGNGKYKQNFDLETK